MGTAVEPNVHPQDNETPEQKRQRKVAGLLRARSTNWYARTGEVLGDVAVFLVYMTALGCGIAILRALWLLAGKV